MALEFLTENLKFKISQLSQDDLEQEFELYRSLQARSVRDEIYQELLAQELDKREQEEYEYEQCHMGFRDWSHIIRLFMGLENGYRYLILEQNHPSF
jgi:hypothetical protein